MLTLSVVECEEKAETAICLDCRRFVAASSRDMQEHGRCTACQSRRELADAVFEIQRRGGDSLAIAAAGWLGVFLRNPSIWSNGRARRIVERAVVEALKAVRDPVFPSGVDDVAGVPF